MMATEKATEKVADIVRGELENRIIGRYASQAKKMPRQNFLF